MRPIRKCVFTLATKGYEEELTSITLPLLRFYAERIGADFFVIEDRQYPEWPIQCEKLQIRELASKMGLDWAIYFDSDAIVHPEMLDVTALISKDTVMHAGCDMANVRWKYDEYFLRDGRHIGSCNWFAVASDWCLDLWRFPDDLTPEECAARIEPTVGEKLTALKTGFNLIDDFLLGRNIARFGLKFKGFYDIVAAMNINGGGLMWHQYTKTAEHKLEEAKQIIAQWSLNQEYAA